MYAGSKIRLNKARYLVYSIVDAIVDEIFPIVQHFHQVLVGLQGKVHSESATPLETVKVSTC
jgi:Mg2+ and Co2+ transporter CorA